MDLRSRIIQLCAEMKKSGEQSFYNDVAKIVNKEYGVDMTGESIRGVCRRYRKQNNLDDSFNPISIPDIADDKQFSDGFDGYINPNKKILTINSLVKTKHKKRQRKRLKRWQTVPKQEQMTLHQQLKTKLNRQQVQLRY